MSEILKPLPPGSKIGILGGGQLGRMLATAAARLGMQCHVYTDQTGPACDVAANSHIGPYEDLGRISEFAASVDVVTYEFENVPLGAAAAASARAPLRPGARALEVTQDRVCEKQFLAGLDLPVAPFAQIGSVDDLNAGLKEISTPALLKTARFGYDGKGQARIEADTNTEQAWETLLRAPCVLEGFVDFEYEVSVLLVRGLDGTLAFYDLPLNDHANGILRTSAVPSPLPAGMQDKARAMAAKVATELDYVGVLAIELFYAGKEAPEPLIINEMAPRVHNSGHWTMDACLAGQFENHIRAICGWPLASTARSADAIMTNLIGDEINQWPQIAAEPGAHLHIYAKNIARPGRKMGHVNRLLPISTGQPPVDGA